MNKKRYIMIFSISVSIIIIFASLYFKGVSKSPKYPMISENATVIKYNDISENKVIKVSDTPEDNTGIHIKNGVAISYIDGHDEKWTWIWFVNYRPYTRLEMYESDGTFIVIYDEEKKGNKKDRFITLKGRPGYKSIGEYKVEVYRNGKRVRNVEVGFGLE